MNREITFTVNTIDEIRITSDTFNGEYTGRRLFAGYEDESLATRLTFVFSAEFDGYTTSIILNGTDTAFTTYYDIPSTLAVPEVIEMRIKAVLGTQTLLSPVILLEIKKNV